MRTRVIAAACVIAIVVFAVGSASGARSAAQPGARTATKPGAALKPGEYIADGGFGWLYLTNPQGKGIEFKLESIGGNFHTCTLPDTRIVDGLATLVAYDGAQACVVRFAPTAEGIDIFSNEACREYCGMRAVFDGLYLRPVAACGSAAVRATREEFKRLYDRKQYAPALAKLSPLPQRCARTLHRYESSEILNDIAITYYKLGRSADCLRTLEPLTEDAAMSDDEIRDDYPPSDAEAWLPIVKAARFNLGLCRKTSR
jgi:hypothetical protein